MSPDEPTPEVDPRFDPVFQRGYDPDVHAPRPSTPDRRDTIGVPPAARVAPAPLSAAPASAVPVEPAAVGEAEEEIERPNPWWRALLLTSLGMLLLAVGFLWAVGQRDVYASSGTPDAGELFIQQLAFQLPTPLLTAGVLGLMLSIALGAVRRSRR